MITYTVSGEDVQVQGERACRRLRRWLDSTARFRIDQSVYDVPEGQPAAMRLRVPQLDGSFERFDLVGTLLDVKGQAGREIFVESKAYSSAGAQAALYSEYLAVCYSAFVKQMKDVGGPPDWEFMWATTHPFAVTTYTQLTTLEHIQAAVDSHSVRLNSNAFDSDIARELASRLWLTVVSERVEQMIPGLEVQKAMSACLIDLTR